MLASPASAQPTQPQPAQPFVGPVANSAIFVAPGESAQAAIDRAEVGGQVVLRRGIHLGPLKLSRSITLRGESPDGGTVLLHQGPEPALQIEVPTHATIANLAIRWSADPGAPGRSTESPTESSTKSSEGVSGADGVETALALRYEDAPAAIVVRGGRTSWMDCDLAPASDASANPGIAPRAMVALAGAFASLEDLIVRGFDNGFLFAEESTAFANDLVVSDLAGSAFEARTGASLLADSCIVVRCGRHAFDFSEASIHVTDSFVADTGRAAVRLRKKADGLVQDSAFLRCENAFLADGESEASFDHNLVLGSRGAAGVVRDTVSMRVEWNLFGEGGAGLEREGPGASGTMAALPRAIVSDNVFWGHPPGRDLVGFPSGGSSRPSGSILADPNLADPAAGDFRPLAYEERRLEGSDRVPGPREPERLKPLFDAAKLFSTSPLPEQGDPVGGQLPPSLGGRLRL